MYRSSSQCLLIAIRALLHKTVAGMTVFIYEYVIRWQCPQNRTANLRKFDYLVQHEVTC